MDDIQRMRRLAGIQEIMPPDPEEEDRLEDELRAREAKITGMITFAFKQIDIEIADGDVYYDEPSGRQATVRLDADEIALEQLMKLKQTGLAESYLLSGSKNGLTVNFVVQPDLDNGRLSAAPPRPTAPGV